jgi:hypothetical protein
VDTFIADLKDSVKDAKLQPNGKGQMVAVYGMYLATILFLAFPILNDAQSLSACIQVFGIARRLVCIAPNHPTRVIALFASNRHVAHILRSSHSNLR